MQVTQENQLNAQVVQKAWEDDRFKNELMANPVEVMEQFTGQKINLPEGQKLVVVDQTDDSTVYFNIPRPIQFDSLELTEEELEQVAGGLSPTFYALAYGIAFGVTIWAATHQT